MSIGGFGVGFPGGGPLVVKPDEIEVFFDLRPVHRYLVSVGGLKDVSMKLEIPVHGGVIDVTIDAEYVLESAQILEVQRKLCGDVIPLDGCPFSLYLQVVEREMKVDRDEITFWSGQQASVPRFFGGILRVHGRLVAKRT